MGYPLSNCVHCFLCIVLPLRRILLCDTTAVTYPSYPHLRFYSTVSLDFNSVAFLLSALSQRFDCTLLCCITTSTSSLALSDRVGTYSVLLLWRISKHFPTASTVFFVPQLDYGNTMLVYCLPWFSVWPNCTPWLIRLSTICIALIHRRCRSSLLRTIPLTAPFLPWCTIYTWWNWPSLDCIHPTFIYPLTWVPLDFDVVVILWSQVPMHQFSLVPFYVTYHCRILWSVCYFSLPATSPAIKIYLNLLYLYVQGTLVSTI